MEYIDCRNSSLFKYSLYEVRYGLVATVKSLGMLLSGKGSKDDIAGPIGMAKIIGDVEEVSKPYGFLTTLMNMFNIAMLLSINLGVMNMLPIPALDGGRLIFLLIEAIRGKPVPADKEGIVQLAGVILLFALMIFVMFNDIMRFFN
jgi:regulator of sigma E protease